MNCNWELFVFYFVLLPCRSVLGRDAPRQVVVAVIPAGVVKKVPSGGEDMVRYACNTLWTFSELESASLS